MSNGDYAALPRWQSTAGTGPTLRGHHAAPPQADAATLHFLHGNGFCGGVYWPMLQTLARDYGLFTHDLEAHGDSDAPARFSGTGAILRRIPQVMRDQGLHEKKLVGIGHSYGGALTLAVAAANPGLFKALVLLDPILLPAPAWWWFRNADRFGRNPMSNGARRRRDRWASREEADQRLRGRGIYAGWTTESFDAFLDFATRDQGSERVLCCPKQVEAAIFADPVYPWKALPRVEVPVLFVRGAQSYEFFPWTERIIRRLKPEVQMHQLPGGHCFMQQDPRAASDLVGDFLRKLRL